MGEKMKEYREKSFYVVIILLLLHKYSPGFPVVKFTRVFFNKQSQHSFHVNEFVFYYFTVNIIPLNKQRFSYQICDMLVIKQISILND